MEERAPYVGQAQRERRPGRGYGPALGGTENPIEEIDAADENDRRRRFFRIAVRTDRYLRS